MQRGRMMPCFVAAFSSFLVFESFVVYLLVLGLTARSLQFILSDH